MPKRDEPSECASSCSALELCKYVGFVDSLKLAADGRTATELLEARHDCAGCGHRRTRIVTLGEGVLFVGTLVTYDVSGIIAIGSNALRCVPPRPLRHQRRPGLVLLRPLLPRLKAAER